MERLAKMAMLKVSDAEKAWADIEKVLNIAEILNEASFVEGVASMRGVPREDEAVTGKEGLLDNAPVVRDGYVVVPKVVGE